MQFSLAGYFCQIRHLFVYRQIQAKSKCANAGANAGLEDLGRCIEKLKTGRGNTGKCACRLRAALLFFPAFKPAQKCRAGMHAGLRRTRESGAKARHPHARAACNQGYVLGNLRVDAAANARLPPTAHVNTSSTPTPRAEFIRYGSKCWCFPMPDIPFQSHEVCNEQ